MVSLPPSDITIEAVNTQLQLFYNSIEPSVRVNANTWLLSFQKSPSAWEVCKQCLLLPQEGLLQFMAAQTLAFKAKQTSDQLSVSQKRQLVHFLFEYLEVLFTDQTIDSQDTILLNFSQTRSLTVSLVERLCECIAYLLMQCLQDFNGFINELFQFSERSLSKNINVLSLRWASLIIFTKFPEAIEVMNLPNKRDISQSRLMLCEAAVPHLQSFVSQCLFECSLILSSDPSSNTNEIFLITESCVQSSYTLLTKWIELFPHIKFLYDINLTKQLSRIILMHDTNPNTTDFCVFIIAHLSNYMGIWKEDLSDDTNAYPYNNNFMNYKLLEAWSRLSYSNNEVESTFISSTFIRKFSELQLSLQRISQDTQEFQELEDDQQHTLYGINGLTLADANIIMGWSHVAITFLEGYPQFLFTRETSPETELLKKVFFQLWTLHPSTAMLCFDIITTIKELQRESLIPETLLVCFIEDFLAHCLTSLLKQARRDQSYWGFLKDTRQQPPNSISYISPTLKYSEGMSVSTSPDEREVFLEEASEVFSDLFLLHQNIYSQKPGVHTQFLLAWVSSFTQAIEKNDLEGLEIHLYFTAKLIKSYQSIPEVFFNLFTIIQSIPLDPHCGKAISELIISSSPYMNAKNISPDIWIASFRCLITHMKSVPLNASKGLYYLCFEANEKFHQFHITNPEQARECLHFFFQFVEANWPRFSLFVDVAIHASCAFLLMRSSNLDIKSNFHILFTPTAASLHALITEISNNNNNLTADTKRTAYRLLYRLNYCFSAIEMTISQQYDREKTQNFRTVQSTIDSVPTHLMLRMTLQQILSEAQFNTSAPSHLTPTDFLTPIDQTSNIYNNINPIILWSQLIQLSQIIALNIPFLNNTRHISWISPNKALREQLEGDYNDIIDTLIECLRRFVRLLGLSYSTLPCWNSLLQLCHSMIHNHTLKHPWPDSEYAESTAKGIVLLLISDLFQKQPPYLPLCATTQSIENLSINLTENFPQLLGFYQEAISHLSTDLLYLLNPIVSLMNSCHLNTKQIQYDPSAIRFMCKPSDFSISLQICIYLIRSPNAPLIHSVFRSLKHFYSYPQIDGDYYVILMNNFDSLLVTLFSYIPLWGLKCTTLLWRLIETLINEYPDRFTSTTNNILKQPRAIISKLPQAINSEDGENTEIGNYIQLSDSQRMIILQCFRLLKGKQLYKFIWEFCGVVEGNITLDEFLFQYLG